MKLLYQETEQGFVRSKGFKGEAMRELATEARLSPSVHEDTMADVLLSDQARALDLTGISC